jgi:hypothetical protein
MKIIMLLVAFWLSYAMWLSGAEPEEFRIDPSDRAAMRSLWSSKESWVEPDNWTQEDFKCFSRFGPESYAVEVDGCINVAITPVVDALCAMARKGYEFRAITRTPGTQNITIHCGPIKRGT